MGRLSSKRSWLIDTGDLRHELAILQKTTVIDEGGGRTITWPPFLTVLGHIRATSAYEKYVNSIMNATVSHVITIWYVAGLTASMKLLFAGRIFSIRGLVNVEERNLQWRITAEEVPNVDAP